MDFAQWYTDVLSQGGADRLHIRQGHVHLPPYGYAIWWNIQHVLDTEFKKAGHENVYLPVLIPESLLQKEKDHVEGFAPECAWVTMGGSEKLGGPAVRPAHLRDPVLRALRQHHPLLAGPAQAL